MKVKIDLTVDVDETAWAHEYCIEKSEVRDDIKSLVRNAIYECPAAFAIRSIKENV